MVGGGGILQVGFVQPSGLSSTSMPPLCRFNKDYIVISVCITCLKNNSQI